MGDYLVSLIVVFAIIIGIGIPLYSYSYNSSKKHGETKNKVYDALVTMLAKKIANLQIDRDINSDAMQIVMHEYEAYAQIHFPSQLHDKEMLKYDAIRLYEDVLVKITENRTSEQAQAAE